MKILVLNCGSSSIKYKLYDMDDKSVIAAGGIEKVGLDDSFLKMKAPVAETITTPVPTHDVGVELIFNMLTDAEKRVIATWIDLNATFYGCYEEPCLTKQLKGEPIPMPDRQ